MMQNYATLNEVHDFEEPGILIHDPEPSTSRWSHIEDLDSFFSRIYKYHQSHGFKCMCLQDFFEINQYVFVIFLTIWLWHGIDYTTIFNPNATNTTNRKPSLSDVVLSFGDTLDNFTTLTWICVVIAFLVLAFKVLNKVYQNLQFWDIKQFYNGALGIRDDELDNLNWHEIQTKLRLVQLEQQMCIHKTELTELDIYHRILRQENYMVALVNKKLLPPRLRLPFLGEYVYWTKALRWNVQFLLFWSPWSLFEHPWHLKEEYKRNNLRTELTKRFRKQVLWLAAVNLVLSPIIFVWVLLYNFFNYAEIIKREPGRIGVRHWSLYAKLYLRHFNELDHELYARLTRAYRPATKYVSAFSSPMVTVLAQHVGFLCGALFAVVVVLTLYDEDVLAIENVLTLMTGLGAMVAICRGIIPEETMVWCPESLLQAVIVHTHYMTADWKSRAHTSNVRETFEQLFQYRFVALIEELLSPLVTPFLLFRFVYPRSSEFIDFFRHFTVSVVGVGDVCSFAQMDVKKHGNPQWQKTSLESMESGAPLDPYQQGEDGKVELSLVHFTTTNPTWVPPPESQGFINSIMGDLVPELSDSYAVASSQDLLGQVAEEEMRELPRSFQNMSTTTRATLDGLSSAGPRNSVWKAEGMNMFAPLAMRQSCIALHERVSRRSTGQSAEETTPLLSSKFPSQSSK